MPRTAKQPWFRTSHRAWYVKIGGRQVRLGTDHEAAMERFRELMAGGGEGPVTVARLAELFLADAGRRLRPNTCQVYRTEVGQFAAAAGGMLAADVRPYHVTAWLATRDVSTNTGVTARRSIKTAWAWGVAQGLIPQSGLSKLVGGTVGPRAMVGEDELARWLACVGYPELRLWCDVALATGFRPAEQAALEWRDVDPGKRCCLVRECKTGGKGGRAGQRTVFLRHAALAMLEQQAGLYPTGPLLRGEHGAPWSSRVRQRAFERVSRRAGVRVVPMHLRHVFGSRLFNAGADLLTISKLMGHTTTAMCQRYYVSVADQTLFRALDAC